MLEQWDDDDGVMALAEEVRFLIKIIARAVEDAQRDGDTLADVLLQRVPVLLAIDGRLQMMIEERG